MDQPMTTPDPNEVLHSHYPKCPGCGHQLCHLDRTWDNCLVCDHPLPDALKLNFDLKPL